MKIRLNTNENFPYQEFMQVIGNSPQISLFRFDKI
jgi:hypothetical protein